jgi:hypothetical protein
VGVFATYEKGTKVSEERKDQIIAVLSEKGALGVNALARELSIPLSTLQKYLHSQNYFRMNESKKWDLPERVTTDLKANTMTLMLNSLETAILLIQSQIEESRQAVANALVPVESLKRGFKSIQHPVAESGTVGLPPKWSEALDMLAKFPEIIKSRKDKLSEENYNILRNVDWHYLYLDMGANYFINALSGEIYNLILGETDNLSEDALTTIKEYQKE